MLGRRERRFIEPEGISFSAAARAAILELAVGHDNAEDFRCGQWEFAVEIDFLMAAGLTPEEIRWLVASRYIEPAREVTKPSDTIRQFRPIRKFDLGRKTCFVVTAAGLRLTTIEPDRATWQQPPLRRAA